MFGINSLPCNDSYYFSSYKLENGYFFTSDQFKCDNEFINADYLTDSTNFNLLIGFYDVGRGPHYSTKINKDTADFYKIEFKSKLDTVEVKNFNLSDLKKEGFTNPCKK